MLAWQKEACHDPDSRGAGVHPAVHVVRDLQALRAKAQLPGDAPPNRPLDDGGYELIGESNEVKRQLIELCADEDSFAEGLRSILNRYYVDQVELGRSQGTPGQLAESFAPSGYSGSTLRKAVTFFLHAAKAAELPLSPHFRPPKASPTPNRARRTKTSRPVDPAPSPSTGQSAPAAESHTIELASGGTVTVSCSTSFLALSRHDRDFLFELVDRLKDYAVAGAGLQNQTPKEVLRDGPD